MAIDEQSSDSSASEGNVNTAIIAAFDSVLMRDMTHATIRLDVNYRACCSPCYS